MARPKLKIDPLQVEQLAAIQCSYAEMAAVLGCVESTLTRRYAQAIKKGREVGKSSLKRAQYKSAVGGNSTMLIWLGKQHLGQKDEQLLKGEGFAQIINIIRPNYGSKTQEVSGRLSIHRSPVSSNGVSMGNGKEPLRDSTGS